MKRPIPDIKPKGGVRPVVLQTTSLKQVAEHLGLIPVTVSVDQDLVLEPYGQQEASQ